LRSGVGGNAEAIANCIPQTEGGAALLIAVEEAEAENGRNDKAATRRGIPITPVMCQGMVTINMPANHSHSCQRASSLERSGSRARRPLVESS